MTDHQTLNTALSKIKTYALDENHNPYPVSDQLLGEVFASDRRVGSTHVNGCWVSTVFLALDHNHFGGIPILFETMVFTKRKGSYRSIDTAMCRYATWNDAVNGHAAFVLAVRHKNLSAIKKGHLEIQRTK